MAKKHLEQYDKNGKKLDIYLNDDEVMVDGQTLADKLSDMEEDIEEAGQTGSGDGTVTGVKVGSTTYEPTEGVVDLSTPFAGKVDKNGTDSLMTATEHTKLQNLPTNEQLTQQFGSKANDADVVKSISVNGQAQQKTNGNVNIVVEGAQGNVSVIQPDPADGTFVIRVGENDYTINLNHEHPEYAPLVHTHSQYAQVQVVNGESNLPATLDPKTVYGVKADGVDELEMVVIGGYKFYGGGGGAPGQPVLMKPDAGSTIVVSGVDNGYSGNVLDPKSVQVYIKARNITQPISISVSGTGFSIENNVNQIAAADALAGVNINVLFDGSANSQGGTLILQSTELGTIYYDLAVEYVTYELLDSVGLNGSQWTKSTYKINSATKVEMTVKFTENSNTRVIRAKNGAALVRSYAAADYQTSHFGFYTGAAGTGNDAGAYMLTFYAGGGIQHNGAYNQLRFNTNNNPDATFLNKGTITFTPGSSASTAAFNGKSLSTDNMQSTAVTDTFIGLNPREADPLPFDNFDLQIFGLVFSEGGVNQRNFIPVSRDNVACLYDTVTGETLFSLGSEDFVANQLSNNS